jgi:hypothetical protein
MVPTLLELPKIYRTLKETPNVMDVVGREGGAFPAIPPEQMEIVLTLDKAGAGVTHVRYEGDGRYRIVDGRWRRTKWPRASCAWIFGSAGRRCGSRSWTNFG